MKIILIQAGSFKFYYGRYKTTETISNKQSIKLDENKDLDDHYVEIPIFIAQPYNNKGPKDDKSIDSVWEYSNDLDETSMKRLQHASYGSKHLVILLLNSLGFVEIESRKEKKKVEVYTPDQIESAYKETDTLDKVLKGNMM